MINSRYSSQPVYDALDPRGTSHPTIAIRQPTPLAPGTTMYQHLVTGVETIEYLAWRYYGDSKYWWRIADANNLSFPLDIPTGTTLSIPGANDSGTITRTRSFG
jgi:nucleoid-associated protein YgaU